MADLESNAQSAPEGNTEHQGSCAPANGKHNDCEADASGIKLFVPEGVRYNCQGCGRCCSGWSVGMTEEDYGRIKDIDWQSLHPELAGKELFFHREEEFKAGLAGHPHYTKPRADGSCPFLINKLCFIHGHLGEDQKPVTCRLFPYSFVETPSGVYTGVVYNSMAAAKNQGDLLTDQKDALLDYLALTRKYATALNKTAAAMEVKDKPKSLETGAQVDAPVESNVPFQTVELTLGTVVTWEEFLEVDNKLMDLMLNRKDLNIFQVLPAGSEILQKAIRLKRAGSPMTELRDFDPVVASDADMTPGAVEEMTLRTMFYRFFIYPMIRVDEKGLWQMQRRNILNPVNAFMVARSFSRYTFSALGAILFKHAKVPGAGNMNLEAAAKKHFEPLSKELDDYFKRWLYLKLFAKTYFGPAAAGFGVASGYNCLMASIIAVMIFAKCCATSRKEKALNIDDIYEAYWRLDRELLTMGQVSKQESVAFNFAFATPRLFHKMLFELQQGFKGVS